MAGLSLRRPGFDPSSVHLRIIYLFINCNWVVARWQWLFYM